VLCLDLFLIGWTVLIGGLIATYYERPRVSRWGMMALVMLLVLLGPLIAGVVPEPADPATAKPRVHWLMTSPITGGYEITRDRSWTGQTAVIDERHWAGVGLSWLGGAIAWSAAWWAGRRGGPQHGPEGARPADGGGERGHPGLD
jgi:hypothetical protein